MKGKAISLSLIIIVSFILGCLADPKKDVKRSVDDGNYHQFPCLPHGHPCINQQKHQHHGEKLRCCGRLECYNPDGLGQRRYSTGTCS